MHKEGDKNPSSAVKKNAEDTFKGDQTKYYVKDIKKYIKFTNSKTILDYGSGKAVFYKKKDLKIKSESDKKEYNTIKDFWNVNKIEFYDVGVKEYQVFPNKNFDVGCKCNQTAFFCYFSVKFLTIYVATYSENY